MSMHVGGHLPDGALIGCGGWVTFFALLCAGIGVTFFGGTTRETVYDKETLLGAFLVGVALLTHGGFVTLLRSSPRANFSGCIEASSPLFQDMPDWQTAWIAVYDLGYPPTQQWFDPASGKPAANLDLTIKWTHNNPFPLSEELFNLENTYWVNCVYRRWDLQVISLDAVPSPSGLSEGLRGQHWASITESPEWYLAEATLGLIFTAASVFTFVCGRKPTVRINPFAPYGRRDY